MNVTQKLAVSAALAICSSSALAYHIDFNASYTADSNAKHTALALVQSGGCPRVAFRNLAPGTSSQYTASGSFCKPYGLWSILASQHEHVSNLSDILKWPHAAQFFMVDNLSGGHCQINLDQDMHVSFSGNCHAFQKS